MKSYKDFDENLDAFLRGEISSKELRDQTNFNFRALIISMFVFVILALIF